MNLYIFGAGASAAEGAPATQEFFARAWELLAPGFDQQVQAVWRFLEQLSRIPIDGPDSFAYIPAVDEVVSLVDWSLHVNQGLGATYDPPRLHQVRRDLEYLIRATLEAAVRNRPAGDEGPHARFVRALLERGESGRSVLISLNYDTLLDEALARAGLGPDYGFHTLNLTPRQGPLLAKLHGSLNWALCPACGRIEVGAQGCSRCGNQRLHGLIISPTWLKSYDAAHLQHIWDLAMEAVQRAERIIFVGYSMPPADVAIYQLLRRGLMTSRRQSWPSIEVINHHRTGEPPAERKLKEEAVTTRFRRLFGPSVRFDFTGFHGQI